MRGLFAANLRRFKLVTFDVTDTILTFRKSPAVEYADAVRRLGFPAVSETKLAAHFSTQFKQLNSEFPNFGRGNGRNQLTWENWWRRLIINILTKSEAQLTQLQMRKVADHLIDRYESADCYDKVPAANELIDEMRRLGLTIGIISNFDPRLKFTVEHVGLPRFDFILASYEVGAAKPSAQIFDLALKMTPGSVSAEEALHVGNTPALDYLGAREAGWSSALIANKNGSNEWRLSGKVSESHVFDSLADFYEKLDNETIDWDRNEEKFERI